MDRRAASDMLERMTAEGKKPAGSPLNEVASSASSHPATELSPKADAMSAEHSASTRVSSAADSSAAVQASSEQVVSEQVFDLQHSSDKVPPTISVDFEEEQAAGPSPASSAKPAPAEKTQEGLHPAPARELNADRLSTGTQRRYQPAPPQEGRDDSNTTLQSMMRPELLPGGVTDSRRFMRLEREQSESAAAIKFLEKRLSRSEKEAKMAVLVAAFAVIIAILALVL